MPFAAKFTSAGAPDPSFGTNGVVTLNSLPLGLRHHRNRRRRVRTDRHRRHDARHRGGRARGHLRHPPDEHGATDTTFGTNGVAQFAISTVDNRSDRGTTIDVQPDGKIVVGGRTQVTAGLGYDFLLMRLDANGRARPVVRHQRRRDDPLPRNDRDQSRPQARAAAGRQDRAGRRRHVRRGRSQCGIARFDANGVLDPGFGTGGRAWWTCPRDASTSASSRTASW